MSRLAEIEADAHAHGIDVRSLPSADRRALVIAALAATMPFPPTSAQKAATAAAVVPAEADGPFHAGGWYIADASLAAHTREQIAARQAREEARRRAELAAFPSRLDEVREALDAVVAQDWAEQDAA